MFYLIGQRITTGNFELMNLAAIALQPQPLGVLLKGFTVLNKDLTINCHYIRVT